MAGDLVNIHVIAHCVGSLSFAASLAAGHIKDIKTFISNSVSLTPIVRLPSRVKIQFAPFLVDNLLPMKYLSPKTPYMPGPRFGKLLWLIEQSIRQECKEPACHMTSFMWGWGFPACFLHKNMDPITHRRLKDLFGGTTMNYFRHIRKMLDKGESVPYTNKDSYQSLPKSYLESFAKNTNIKTLLISGDQNRIFPGSNQRTKARVLEMNQDYPIEYKEFPEYGHQDIFMGKASAKHVFPVLIAFLKDQR